MNQPDICGMLSKKQKESFYIIRLFPKIETYKAKNRKKIYHSRYFNHTHCQNRRRNNNEKIEITFFSCHPIPPFSRFGYNLFFCKQHPHNVKERYIPQIRQFSDQEPLPIIFLRTRGKYPQHFAEIVYTKYHCEHNKQNAAVRLFG